MNTPITAHTFLLFIFLFSLLIRESHAREFSIDHIEYSSMALVNSNNDIQLSKIKDITILKDSVQIIGSSHQKCIIHENDLEHYKPHKMTSKKKIFHFGHYLKRNFKNGRIKIGCKYADPYYKDLLAVDTLSYLAENNTPSTRQLSFVTDIKKVPSENNEENVGFVFGMVADGLDAVLNMTVMLLQIPDQIASTLNHQCYP